MRAIEITTDGHTTTLRCNHCGATTSITDEDYRRQLTHEPTCLHAARVRREARDAGIRTAH